MKKFVSYLTMTAVLLSAFFCSKQETIQSRLKQVRTGISETRVPGLLPKIIVYVETNDVNPANAADWRVRDSSGTFDECLIDYVHLFAANIHKTTTSPVEPVLYLNDKLYPVLERDYVANVQPLKDEGIKVLLTILGDHQGIGVANMTVTQQKQFVNELLYAYYKYDLDGIDFDDEYADYPWYPPVPGTPYANIIALLRAKLPAGALIAVFDWGYTNYIDSTALNCIDYVTHGHFGLYIPHTSSQYVTIPNVPKSKWSPFSWNLGTYTSADLPEMHTQAAQTATDGYPYIMFFNLRTRDDHDPLDGFQEIVDSLWGDLTVYCTDGNRPRSAAIPGGNSISPANAKQWLMNNNKPYY